MRPGSCALRALLGAGMVAGMTAGCGTSAQPPISSALATNYVAIATPANKKLDRSFDELEDEARAQDIDLAHASAVLTTIAATERRFDRDLLALRLPGRMASTAKELVRVNEARANLTVQASTATSGDSLRRYQSELDAMNVPVETQVKALRTSLGLPPPDTD
ncbi:MAG TPA: hypothetical protein VFE15_16750 [Marmoricola sp.]|jgi:hypothetical protein|nr:hypothetical protein [Marmoricola sp.]